MKSLGSLTAAKTILLVCPTMWDEADLPSVVAAGEYRVLIHDTDVSEHPEDFDAIDFIEQAVTAVAVQNIAGVLASDDYPGSIVAAAIARRLELPGPQPATVLLCHHKYYSRVAQRRAVPEAVPAFSIVVGDSFADTTLQFPLFVKPVESFFSLFAEQVDDARQLGNLARRAERHLHEFVKPFNQLLAHYAPSPVNGSHLLAEAPLRGQQVTVEGCVFHGEAQIIGISDSIMYPGMISFLSFRVPVCVFSRHSGTDGEPGISCDALDRIQSWAVQCRNVL